MFENSDYLDKWYFIGNCERSTHLWIQCMSICTYKYVLYSGCKQELLTPLFCRRIVCQIFTHHHNIFYDYTIWKIIPPTWVMFQIYRLNCRCMRCPPLTSIVEYEFQSTFRNIYWFCCFKSSKFSVVVPWTIVKM